MYETKPYFYGTGRRKNSVARVRVYNGTGKITINDRDIEEYFGLETLKLIVRQPLSVADVDGKFDIVVRVAGGGVPVPRPAAVRREPASCPEEGWLPDPRSSYEGAQEVRPQGCPSRSPVQQAIILVQNSSKTPKPCGFRGFSFSYKNHKLCLWANLARALDRKRKHAHFNERDIRQQRRA